MVQDVPAVFEGTVEVDETYLGGQWKNKRHAAKCHQSQSKRGRGTTKQPVFGILCRNGKVWAELIDGVEVKQLPPEILKQVKKGLIPPVQTPGEAIPALQQKEVSEKNTPFIPRRIRMEV